jgi:hypothetical protein
VRHLPRPDCWHINEKTILDSMPKVRQVPTQSGLGKPRKCCFPHGSQDDDSMPMCHSNSHESYDDDSMPMCHSKSHESYDDDSMIMCLLNSQDDDSMPMCHSNSHESYDDDSMPMCHSNSHESCDDDSMSRVVKGGACVRAVLKGHACEAEACHCEPC